MNIAARCFSGLLLIAGNLIWPCCSNLLIVLQTVFEGVASDKLICVAWTGGIRKAVEISKELKNIGMPNGLIHNGDIQGAHA